MPLTAVILAGGLGTRLRSVVPDLPKPMAPVAGRPFLEYLMDYWVAQGVSNFVLSVGYRKEAIIDHFGDAYRSIQVSYAIEQEPLGTGGGLLLAAQGLSETFLVLNGDTFFDVNLNQLEKFHKSRKSDWTFALFRSTDTSRFMGMRLNANQEITSLRVSAGEGDCLVNGGVYLVEPAALSRVQWQSDQKISLEDEFLPSLQRSGSRICGLASAGHFLDIGLPNDYSRAPELLLRNA